MPKRCIFDDDIECFAEGCFAECRHHPHSGIIYVKEAEGLKKEPKKHKRLGKALETIGFILAIPVFLIFYFICLFLGGKEATDYIDQAGPKELAIYMLLVYGLVFALIFLYFSPPLYLPPNLAIIALFLGIGGPAILVSCLIIYAKMKKKKQVARELDFKSMHAFDAAYEYLQEQLTELKEQLGRGVITQEEYEQKKKKLLGKSET